MLEGEREKGGREGGRAVPEEPAGLFADILLVALQEAWHVDECAGVDHSCAERGREGGKERRRGN
jgi:hypothetical protein